MHDTVMSHQTKFLVHRDVHCDVTFTVITLLLAMYEQLPIYNSRYFLHVTTRRVQLVTRNTHAYPQTPLITTGCNSLLTK